MVASLQYFPVSHHTVLKLTCSSKLCSLVLCKEECFTFFFFLFFDFMFRYFDYICGAGSGHIATLFLIQNYSFLKGQYNKLSQNLRYIAAQIFIPRYHPHVFVPRIPIFVGCLPAYSCFHLLCKHTLEEMFVKQFHQLLVVALALKLQCSWLLHSEDSIDNYMPYLLRDLSFPDRIGLKITLFVFTFP